jgi:hypothetical protein
MSFTELHYEFAKSLNYAIVGGTITNTSLVCPNKHLWITRFRNFKKGYRCPKCKAESFVYNVKIFTESISYKFIHYDKYLFAECDKGHLVKMLFRDLKKVFQMQWVRQKISRRYMFIYGC